MPLPSGDADSTHTAPYQRVLSPPPGNISTSLSSYSLPQPPLVLIEEARTGTDLNNAHPPLNRFRQSLAQTAQGSINPHLDALYPHGTECLHTHLPSEFFSDGRCPRSVEGIVRYAPSHCIPNIDCTSINFDGAFTEERSTLLAALPSEVTGIVGETSSNDLRAASSTFTLWNGQDNPRQGRSMHANVHGLEGLTRFVYQPPDSVAVHQPPWPHRSRPALIVPATTSPQWNGLGRGQAKVQTRPAVYTPIVNGVAEGCLGIPQEDRPMLQVEVNDYMESMQESSDERSHITWDISDAVPGGNFLPPFDPFAFFVDDATLDLLWTEPVVNEGNREFARLPEGTLPRGDTSDGGEQFPHSPLARECSYISGGVSGPIDISGHTAATARPEVGYVVDRHPSIDPNRRYFGH